MSLESLVEAGERLCGPDRQGAPSTIPFLIGQSCRHITSLSLLVSPVIISHLLLVSPVIISHPSPYWSVLGHHITSLSLLVTSPSETQEDNTERCLSAYWSIIYQRDTEEDNTERCLSAYWSIIYQRETTDQHFKPLQSVSSNDLFCIPTQQECHSKLNLYLFNPPLMYCLDKQDNMDVSAEVFINV